MAGNVTGSLYADKGYVSTSLKAELAEQGIDFITGQRSNMKLLGGYFGTLETPGD